MSIGSDNMYINIPTEEIYAESYRTSIADDFQKGVKEEAEKQNSHQKRTTILLSLICVIIALGISAGLVYKYRLS